MKKAIFFDIDGTLISFRTHKIPDSTLEAVAAVRKLGVKTFLCTSRAKQFLTNVPDIGFDGLVCLTGTHCIDSEGRDINCMKMDPADVAAIVSDAQHRGQPLMGVSSDSLYVLEPEHPAVVNCLGMGGLKVSDISRHFRPFPDLISAADPVDWARGCGIMQVIAFFHSGPEEERAMSLMPHSHTERWTESFVDVISNGVNKALGVDVMGRHFGFSPEEAIAIGDGANDIPMLLHSGTGIAMGNASDKVKAVADYVTGDVDDGGLADALRHYFEI